MAEQDWELSYAALGDPHHEITAACQERGWLELIVNPETTVMSDREDSFYHHPKGYFQPGVLALDSGGRVLYRWRGIPTRKNMGGATERPTANHVYENLSAALATPGADDAVLDEKPELDSRGLPWPLFMSLLVANGWFIKPKTFPHISGGPSLARRLKHAMIRIPIFIFAWVIAFTLLPTLWVGAAFLAWAAWLTPFIHEVNGRFQNLGTTGND